MRQLSFGLLDMGWHGQDPTAITVKLWDYEQFAATQLYPEVAENAMSTAFSHIFQGGYSSGYYSYRPKF
jgi:peptidyl-dipeptidase Dcp